MAYMVYAHVKLPAVICELGPDFNMKEDMDHVLQDLEQLLDRADQPVYYINDITATKLSFGDIVLGMGMAASAGDVMRHPNLFELIVVCASDIEKLGVKALGQAQYGGIKARIANNLDEALAFIQVESNKV